MYLCTYIYYTYINIYYNTYLLVYIYIYIIKSTAKIIRSFSLTRTSSRETCQIHDQTFTTALKFTLFSMFKEQAGVERRTYQILCVYVYIYTRHNCRFGFFLSFLASLHLIKYELFAFIKSDFFFFFTDLQSYFKTKNYTFEYKFMYIKKYIYTDFYRYFENSKLPRMD